MGTVVPLRREGGRKRRRGRFSKKDIGHNFYYFVRRKGRGGEGTVVNGSRTLSLLLAPDDFLDVSLICIRSPLPSPPRLFAYPPPPPLRWPAKGDVT